MLRTKLKFPAYGPWCRAWVARSRAPDLHPSKRSGPDILSRVLTFVFRTPLGLPRAPAEWLGTRLALLFFMPDILDDRFDPGISSLCQRNNLNQLIFLAHRHTISAEICTRPCRRLCRRSRTASRRSAELGCPLGIRARSCALEDVQ